MLHAPRLLSPAMASLFRSPTIHKYRHTVLLATLSTTALWNSIPHKVMVEAVKGSPGFVPPKRSTSSSSSVNSKEVDEPEEKKPEVAKRPPTPMEKLADRLANDHYQEIVVLMGAGASVSAGIPDFRTPGTGLYDQLQEYNLPFPEAIFDLDYYRHDPQAFTTLAHEIWPGKEGGPKPTLTHAFLKVLQERNVLKRVYTQNIDGLEALAGLPDDFLVECHGHFRNASCISCKEPMPAEDCRQSMVEEKEAPRCNVCGSLVKPDIVFFGEDLPERFASLVQKDTASCDLLVVIGTSLMVMPVAGIPQWVDRKCARVLLNREVVGDFARGKSDRDFVLKDDCDESVKKLCELAGWEKQLEAIHTDILDSEPL